MTSSQLIYAYYQCKYAKQNGTKSPHYYDELTPAQRRRANHKANKVKGKNK